MGSTMKSSTSGTLATPCSSLLHNEFEQHDSVSMSTFAWVKTIAGSTQSGCYVLIVPPLSPSSPSSPPSPPAPEALPPRPCPAGTAGSTKLTTFSKTRAGSSIKDGDVWMMTTDTITTFPSTLATPLAATHPVPSRIGALKPCGLSPLSPLSPLSAPRVIGHTLEGLEVMPGAVILTDQDFTNAIKRQYYEGIMIMAWKRDREAWLAKKGLSDEVLATMRFLDVTFSIMPAYGRPPASPSKRPKAPEAPEAPESPKKPRSRLVSVPEVKDTATIRVAAVAALLDGLSVLREKRIKTLVSEVKLRTDFLYGNYLTSICNPVIALPTMKGKFVLHEISGAGVDSFDEFNALIVQMKIKPLSAFQTDRCNHFVLTVNGVIKGGVSVLFAKINNSLRLCASIEILVSDTPGGGTALLEFLYGFLAKRSGGTHYIVLQAAQSKIAKDFWKQHATFNKRAYSFVFGLALLHSDYLIACDTVPMLIRI